MTFLQKLLIVCGIIFFIRTVFFLWASSSYKKRSGKWYSEKAKLENNYPDYYRSLSKWHDLSKQQQQAYQDILLNIKMCEDDEWKYLKKTFSSIGLAILFLGVFFFTK